jgi:hypothetical protein
LLDYLSPNIVLELSCFIIAAICVAQDKHMIWRSMFAFLLLTCFLEITGRIIGRRSGNNDWIYNLFIIAETAFTGAMYVHLLWRYTKNYKLHITLFAVLAVLYAYELSLHSFFVFNDITTAAMSVLFIGYGLYYYYLFIKDPGYLNLNTHPAFWWVAGSLFFYYGSSVISLYFAIFKVENRELFTYRRYAFLCFNIIHYGLWSYSFICRYRQRKLIH